MTILKFPVATCSPLKLKQSNLILGCVRGTGLTATTLTLPTATLGSYTLDNATIIIVFKSGNIKEEFTKQFVGLLIPWASQIGVCTHQHARNEFAAEQALSDPSTSMGLQEVDGEEGSGDDLDSISSGNSVSRCCSPELQLCQRAAPQSG
ncbi:hypothetical protein BDN71DRAFT_1432463 [Pleurotus eryngii]|uniref:Uncharacterized protein n=1 Tax=Pleurotus eryngii TaxID=5323 RepID=A0A9P5ZT29_PLEER|nr:hypothetical protein BDN71DRAFT_1432463 [Pleurotus eryngii]